MSQGEWNQTDSRCSECVLQVLSNPEANAAAIIINTERRQAKGRNSYEGEQPAAENIN